MTFRIKPAEPTKGRILMALAGPQASGKTTSALRIATGITQVTGGKICLIDTENKRALRYAKDFQFNHMEFDPPFSPLRYLEAVNAAAAAGYDENDVLIIDSMTHEHDGPGGVLAMHEEFLDKRAGSDFAKREKMKFTAWIKPKADRNTAIQMGIQRNRANIILCFRAKEKVAMVKVNGKSEVVNAGWQPIGGEEYFHEMDITMILPQGSMGKPNWNEAASRINEFGEGPLKKTLYNIDQINENTGRFIAEWTAKLAAPKVEENPTRKLANAIHAAITKCANEGELSSVIEIDFAEDLQTVKAESQTAYDFLMNAVAVKRKSLAGV